MRKVLTGISAALVLMLGMVVVANTPAYATTDDTSITITATPQTLTLPTLITYTVKATVQPGSANMSGTVRVMFPNTPIGMINATNPLCVQTGLRQIDCSYGPITAGQTQTWYLQGNTVLLGTLNISTSATQIDSAPLDSNASNDTQTATCTVLLSLITSC